jgi:peptidoglycan/LPS O-acetylase OafA/YrhL
MSAWGYNLFPGGDFRGIGRSGVVLFFVLSSFLLTSQILSWAPRLLLSPKRWLSYFEARIFRIWPLFLFVLAFSLTTSHLRFIPVVWKASAFLSDLPVPMTLNSLQEHVLMRKGVDILWTIPVEFKFYLLLPLILLAILIPLRDHGMVAMSALGSAILIVFWLIPVADGGVDTFPFIGVFLTGILLAFVRRHDIEKVSTDQSHPVLYETLAWLCFAIFVCLIPSVYFTITGMAMPIVDVESHSLYATLWALMILCMLRGSGIMRRALDSPLLIFLGMISYSLYLWHRIPINLMHRLTYYHYIDFLPHGIKAGIILFVSIGMAYLSYAVIERPIQQWRVRRSQGCASHTIPQLPLQTQ